MYATSDKSMGKILTTLTITKGISKARIFQDAKISLCGREDTFECLELPGSRDALIGVIPLEALGLESVFQPKD